MNILLINYEFPPLGGGGGVACLMLAREWVRMGHHVDYLTSHYGDFKINEVVDGINIIRVPVFGRKDLNHATLLSLISFPVTSLLKGYGLCRRSKYDIINVHFVVPSGVSGILLSQLFRIPLVMSLHGGDIYDPTKKLSPHRNGLLQRIVKRLLDNSDNVIAQSTNTRENTMKLYKFYGNVDIVPLGFIPPDFPPASRRSLGFSEDDIVLISVGRVVKRKGYGIALEALRRLTSIPSWKYMIIGDGPERPNLERLAKEYGIEDRVHFTGYVEEELKFQYFSVSDMYLLSSFHEGFGICLQEAMFSGLPIVSTDNGGQMDFLRNGDNALIVPTGDYRKMAEGLTILMKDLTLRTAMGRRNRELIRQFSIDHIAERYVSIFQHTMDRYNR